MLDGVPLGGARRIVGHGEGETEDIRELELEFGFPGAGSAAITAAGITQQEQSAGMGLPHAPVVLPPARNRASREGGCIVRDADGHTPAIRQDIVNAMRNGHASRVRAEVVIVDQAGRVIPSRPRVLEGAHQFALFGVDADDGQPPTLEAITQIADVEKLLVAIRTGVGGELLVVDAQRIAHGLEQPGDGVGTDVDAEVAERQGDFGGRAAGPFQAGDGVAGRVGSIPDLYGTGLDKRPRVR